MDKRTRSVRAVELAGDERELAWNRFGEELPKLVARMAMYERRAHRVIPVFRLDER